MSEHAFANVTRERGLWTVTMNREDAHNALNAAANRALADIFDAFNADPEATVAILTGNGAAFCSGHDYSELSGGTAALPESGFGGLTRRPYNPKPVIAAVNGDALDEGFELALACDIIVANEDSRFALQQGFWGRAPLEGGVQRLVRQVPLKRALAAALTGAPITATEGVLLGFVNDITGFDQVLPLARDWAGRIQRVERQSAFAIQELAMQSIGEPLALAQSAQYSEVERLIASPEYAESAARVVEGRAARAKK